MNFPIERIKKKLANHEMIRGTHTYLGGVTFNEIYGENGFDVVWVDGEHGFLTNVDILNCLVGANETNMAAFVRVPCVDENLVKPILDMGADGIIFPMVSDKATAERAVKACRYPLDGIRGCAPRRAVHYGSVSMDDYVNKYAKDIFVCCQIEHIDAIKNLDEIMTVEGINLFVFGPADLSASMGHIGHPEHPEVKKALDEATAKLKAANKPFCVSFGHYDETTVSEWYQRGASAIFMGDEMSHINFSCKYLLSMYDKHDKLVK